ncbi:MAG TPA: hypothetical protein VJA94_23365 [Candidatus Angelobacter sp.]
MLAVFIASTLASPQTLPTDVCSPHGFQPGYFPADANLEGAGLFTAFLRAMQEPSLLELAKKPHTVSYRFTWFYPFAMPVAVRLNVRADGTAQLFTKVFSNKAKVVDSKALVFDPCTALNINEIGEVPAVEAAKFTELIKKTAFWSLSMVEPHPDVLDGDLWAIEGVRDGVYHVVIRRIPQPSGYTEIGRYLAKTLAKLDDSVIVIPEFRH